MRWEDEKFVKLYTRDTTDWLALTWQAQGLFCLLLRKVDRAGVLNLGRQGARGVAAHVGGIAAWPDIEGPLSELLDDGCVEVHGDKLVIPKFIEAQSARASNRARVAKKRAFDRDLARHGQLNLAGVPAGNERGNEGGNAEVTKAVTTRLDETRLDETTSSLRSDVSPGGDSNTQSGEPTAIGAQPSAAPGGEPDAAAEAPQPRKPGRRRASAPGKPRNGKPAAAGYGEFVAAYFAAFERARGAKPAFGEKHGRQVKSLLAKPGGLADALARMSRMFDMAPKWPAENPDLATLVGHWDKFAPPVKRRGGRSEPRASDEYPEGEQEL